MLIFLYRLKNLNFLLPHTVLYYLFIIHIFVSMLLNTLYCINVHIPHYMSYHLQFFVLGCTVLYVFAQYIVWCCVLVLCYFVCILVQYIFEMTWFTKLGMEQLC